MTPTEKAITQLTNIKYAMLDSSMHAFAGEIEAVINTLKQKPWITVPISESDCYDILEGRIFNWTFNGIGVKVKLEEEEDI